MAALNKLTWNVVGQVYDRVSQDFYSKNKRRIGNIEFPKRQSELSENQKDEILDRIEDKLNFDINCNFGNPSGIILNEERITYGINEFLNFNFI